MCKVNYVSSSKIPSNSANSVHVMKMCNAFVEEGCEVTLFCPDNSKNGWVFSDKFSDKYYILNRFKIRFIKVPNAKFWQLVYAAKLFHFCCNSSDLIVSRNFFASVFFAVFDKKQIFEVHDDGICLSRLKSLLLRFLISRKKFVGMVFITNSLKARFKSFSLKNTVILPDGADLVISPIKDSEIASLENKNNNLSLGYIGSMNEGKGMEILSKISKKLTSSNLHIIGGEVEQINRWKTCFDLTKVEFYGHKNQVEIRDLVSEIDVFLLPNQKMVKGVEIKLDKKLNNKKSVDIGKFTSPLKMFEYMSYKKPIIASDLEVLREILNDEIALFSDPEDTDSWLENIELMRNPQVRGNIATNAFIEFENNYTWKARANKMLIFSTKAM